MLHRNAKAALRVCHAAGSVRPCDGLHLLSLCRSGVKAFLTGVVTAPGIILPWCRCHCCILTARSDYFAALLSRSELLAADTAQQGEDASLAPAPGQMPLKPQSMGSLLQLSQPLPQCDASITLHVCRKPGTRSLKGPGMQAHLRRESRTGRCRPCACLASLQQCWRWCWSLYTQTCCRTSQMHS